MRNKLSSAALGKFFRRRQKATFGILSNEEVLPSCSASRTVSRRIILVDQIVSHQSVPTNRYFSATKKTQTGGGKRKYVPRKAAVQLTDRARTFFKRLLEDNPEKVGIMLYYKQASSGQPRMVFSFGFVTVEDIASNDEGVSLEVDENGNPVRPGEALEDGKQKLYIHGGAFLKVLGATVDIDLGSVTPILYDREGNQMDPNA